jgi:hypothetical protein
MMPIPFFRRTTAFTCRAGCKERDVWKSRNAGPVKCNALFGLGPLYVDFPNSFQNNASAFAFPSSVKPTDLFLLTGLSM